MDQIATELSLRGFAVSKWDLLRDGFEGFHFQIGDAEIVYRLADDNETVILPLYRNAGSRSGLRNRFAALIWFVELLAQERLGLQRVKGLIRAQDGTAVMSTPRIAEFYKRLFGAKTLEVVRGEEWLYLDLKDFRPLRHIRQRQAHS